MPFLEIATGLLVTYVSSEWLYGSKRRAFSGVAVLAALHALSAVLSSLVWPSLPAAVRVPLVAVAFISTLYVDCVRYGQLPPGDFVQAVVEAIVRLLPLCPLLSVLIGAGFLVVAQACEALDLPTAWLNWPVYYGIMYGPFASVYVSVKAAARTHALLPI